MKQNTIISLFPIFYSGTIVNSLLENGADVTIKNRKKQTALSLAQNKNVVQIFTDFANNPKIDMSRSYSQVSVNSNHIVYCGILLFPYLENDYYML